MFRADWRIYGRLCCVQIGALGRQAQDPAGRIAQDRVGRRRIRRPQGRRRWPGVPVQRDKASQRQRGALLATRVSCDPFNF